MKNWGAWIKPFCALLAAILLLAAPLDGALAARDALVKVSSATARSSASGGGKAVFTLKKGARVTVTAVKGSVAKVAYKGKSGYLLTTCLSLSAADAQRKLLRGAVVYKSASKSGEPIGKLSAGDYVQVLQTKGNWAKVQKGDSAGFIAKSAFEETEVKAAEISSKSADTAKTLTTTVNAKLFAKASQSAAYKKVPAGTKVTVVSEKGGWYKVSRSGVTGFMLKKAFQKKAEATAKATAASFKKLKNGSSGSSVLKLQNRLEALGYLDIVPNGRYASTTASAVRLFQSVNSLKKTGVADSDTQSALYASSAKKSGILSASMKPGDKGTGVQRLQMRLRSKGYYPGKVNGKYESTTRAAVAAFQAAAGLAQDGAAGPATLKSLYSSKAPKAPKVKAVVKAAATPTPKPAATPKPTAVPKPAKTAKAKSNSSSSKAEKVIATAKAKLGKPYVFGSVGPSSYDCSGLLMVAYGTVGISLPHSACTIGYSYGKKVTRSGLERGDIVCFNTVSDGDQVDHVGIYLGNGSFLHASSGQGRVVISTLTGYYASAFSWGRSVL